MRINMATRYIVELTQVERDTLKEFISLVMRSEKGEEVSDEEFKDKHMELLKSLYETI